MKKIADRKGEDAIILVGELLPVIEEIIAAGGKRNGRTPLTYLGDVLKEKPGAIIKMLEIVSNDPEIDYKNMSAFQLGKALYEMFDDPDVSGLFG